MEFIYGALGALFVLWMTAGGFAVGWFAHKRFCRAKVDPPNAEELRQVRAQQEAFLAMQSYNADVAYGLHKNALEEGEKQ